MIPPDPRQELHTLQRQHDALSLRLQRIEQSIVFKTLRGVGILVQYISKLKKRLLGITPDHEYANWLRAADRGSLLPSADTSDITIVWSIPSWQDRRLIEQRLTTQQTKLILCCPDPPPTWCTAKTATSLDDAAINTPYTVLIHGNASIEPNALSLWRAAIGEHDAAYADWDHIAHDGSPNAPRFTPEHSPQLLEQTLYWGPAFLVRTAIIQHAGAEATARACASAARVPVVLSHLHSTPAPIPQAPSPPARKASASVIICSRNPSLLARCLQALQTSPGIEVVVVTHDVDGPNNLAEVAAKYNAKSVSYARPFHFGLMNAAGAAIATGEILVFLNDDVFAQSGVWLDALADRLTRPNVGIAGALLVYPDTRIQHAGVVIGQLPGPTHIGRLMRQSFYWPWLTATREVSSVTGACFAIHRNLWDELNGFDPSFPVNFNDVDLCLRARRLGYSVVLESRAVLVHEESVTRNPYVFPQEKDRFAERWSTCQVEPDPYFHPELTLQRRDIVLRQP